jgi:protein TonB
MPTCDVETITGRVASGSVPAARANSTTQSARARHGADPISTTTTISVRRQARKEQAEPARTILNPSFVRHAPAAVPAVAAHAGHAAPEKLAAPAAIAALLRAAARHLNAARRPSWIALVASAVAAGVLVWWVMMVRQPDIDARTVVRDNLAAADYAAREGRYSDPPERSALHYYSTVLALDPTNVAAMSGIDRIADHYIDEAKRFILDGQYAPAALALEKVRRIRPEHRRLPLLDAQLRKQFKEILAQAHEANAAKALRDTASKEAGAGKTRGQKSADQQVKLSGLTASLVPAAAAPSTLARTPKASPAAEAASTKLAASTSGEGTSRAPDMAPQASAGNSAAAIPVAENAAAEKSMAGSAPAAGAPEVSTAGLGADEVAVAAIPVAAAAGAGSASGAAVSPESPPPAATPAPETKSAPAARQQRALLRFVQPEYPSEAVMRGYEGWVDLSLDVTPAGVVLNPRIEDTSNGRIFNRAALAAVRQWRYQPHDGGGSSEPDHIKVRVEFKLAPR